MSFRLLLAAAVALLAVLTAPQAVATPAPAPVAVQAAGVEQPPPSGTRPVPAPSTTAPAGPQLDPAQTEAQRTESRRKLTMGITCGVLLVLVVVGRRARTKHRAKVQGS
ncbi:hypothetical protein EV193_10624 [Herbihabitans rhizosphaerae]|uniref:MYXO-CTERM domain-containing protein n=1 Tax=Herbihabitans rhizosphaerae TaxID=1872711 RepID=A0A4Q7KLN4_9PSEU|nr:hypothetical protein [Herbihabitans rhizosphaerae]RZS36790.1 hypothetical protein EV193_10624 [Herbihabitans rhizosphaerae]